MMKPELFIASLMGRGVPSDLAQRVHARFPTWELLCEANAELLAQYFSSDEVETIRRAKARREIPSETVTRLIDECGFRCCLCWDIDRDSGVIIHHIRLHASKPDDSYENLIVVCMEHHSKIHTKWELARHPYPPDLLIRRKSDFIAALAAFKAGKRAAPGREKNITDGFLVPPPLPPQNFIGRDVQATDIEKALENGSRRAAIVGMAGVGKTALAQKIADSCSPKFPGGILWTETATDFPGMLQTLRSWLKSFAIEISSMEIKEQIALLADLLRRRVTSHGPVLLFFDNASERAVKELTLLISCLPLGVSALLTTRESTVAVAIGATEFRIEPLTREQSRRLLEAIAGSNQVRIAQIDVDKLLSLLGDLPLAVELVGRQIAMRTQKPGFSIEKLCRQVEAFDSQILSFPGHRGIALSFALSYDELDPGEKRVFRSFGNFVSDLLACISVAAVNSAQAEEVELILDRLVVVSLLNWGAAVGDYRIHPLLHRYSEMLLNLAEPTEKDSARTQFYKYYTTTAIVTSKEHPTDLQTIDRILPNLIKAIEGAFASGDFIAVIDTVLGISAGMSFFTSRNLERESIPVLDIARKAANTLRHRDAESAIFGHLGTSYSRLGMIKEAVAYYEKAIPIARQTSNDYDLASHLHNLGSTLLSDGKDSPRAERLLHEALAAAERSHNAEVVIGCFSALGNLHRHVGNLAEAARLYSAALETARLAGDRLSEGNNLSNLGLVMNQLGDTVQGEQMIREALSIAVEIGDRRGEGNRTGHLGGFLLAKAEQLPPGAEFVNTLKDARQHVVEAMQIAQKIGDLEKFGSWLMNLGHISFLEGNETEGLRQFEGALNIAKSSGFSLLEAQTHYNLGSMLARKSQFQSARKHFRSSLVLLRKLHSPLAPIAEARINRLDEIIGRKE